MSQYDEILWELSKTRIELEETQVELSNTKLEWSEAWSELSKMKERLEKKELKELEIISELSKARLELNKMRNAKYNELNLCCYEHFDISIPSKLQNLNSSTSSDPYSNDNIFPFNSWVSEQWPKAGRKLGNMIGLSISWSDSQNFWMPMIYGSDKVNPDHEDPEDMPEKNDKQVNAGSMPR